MEKCSYKTRYLGKDWECPLDALPGEEHCYWHKEEDGKEPTKEQLEGLKKKQIVGVYLRKVDLFEADLSKVNLPKAKLSNAHLWRANLYGADLHGADLRCTELGYTDFRGAKVIDAKLQGAFLDSAKLQGADLRWANLLGANLATADFRGANLCWAYFRDADMSGAKFDSRTDLDGSVLFGVNLAYSYFNEAMSFRNARVFYQENEKEINEIVGDALACWFIRILEKKLISKITFFVVTKVLNERLHVSLPLEPAVISMIPLKDNAPDVAANLRGKGLIKYAGENLGIIFFDWYSGCVIEDPETPRRRERSLIRVDGLADLILDDGKIQPKYFYKDQPQHRCKDGCISFYKASYDVYNNLYNFYIANGRIDQAAHVHYRRGEAHRKLRWARGGFKNKARSIFDLLILRTLTGYGDRIGRPIAVSGLIIGLFAFLFWLSDGIVKNVNGKPAAPDWIDYLYHSITTFTSLGYSNIQPNLAAGHLPQILVAAESGLGVLMMALIIFVVTYQVSR